MSKDNQKNTFFCPFYLGSSKIDTDIKMFLLSLPEDSKVTTSIKNVLKSFVQNIPYDWELKSEVNKDLFKKNIMTKLAISKLHDKILYDWYEDKLNNAINMSGIVKNIVHYQLYKDVSAIRIDISEYVIGNRDLFIVKPFDSNRKNESHEPEKKSKIKKETKERANKLLVNVG